MKEKWKELTVGGLLDMEAFRELVVDLSYDATVESMLDLAQLGVLAASHFTKVQILNQEVMLERLKNVSGNICPTEVK